MLLHGGFWRVAYDRTHLAAVADALTAEGFAVANVEYRRVGGGGGWPSTFTDVGEAVDAVQVALADRVDLGSVAYVGHSAGGHLALWAALRDRLPAGAPGRTDARRRVRGVVALAPAADLAAVDRLGLSGGAVRELLGGSPTTVPDRFAATDPAVLGTPRRHHRRRARRARRHRADRGVPGLPRPDRGRRWSRSPAPGTSS